MKITVYPDILFFLNFIIDLILMLGVQIIINERILVFRSIIASVIGAVISVLYYIVRLEMNIRLYENSSIVSKVIDCLILTGGLYILVFVLLGRKNRRNLRRAVCYLLMASATAAGGILLVSRVFQRSTNVLSIFTGSVLGSNALVILLKKKKKMSDIYDVEVICENTILKGKGLMDTGNLLRDPIYGKPVVLMEKNTKLEKLLEEHPERNVPVIYNCIAKSKGYLEGLRIDCILLGDGKEYYEAKDIVLAMFQSKCSGDYSFILNKRLLD